MCTRVSYATPLPLDAFLLTLFACNRDRKTVYERYGRTGERTNAVFWTVFTRTIKNKNNTWFFTKKIKSKRKIVLWSILLKNNNIFTFTSRVFDCSLFYAYPWKQKSFSEKLSNRDKLSVCQVWNPTEMVRYTSKSHFIEFPEFPREGLQTYFSYKWLN